MLNGRILLGIISIILIIINENCGRQYDYEFGYGSGYGFGYPFLQSYGPRETNAVTKYDLSRKDGTTATRIIGGRPADIKSFSYVVSLIYNHEFQCAGTLISKELVLTSANCVNRKIIRFFKIRYGSNSFKSGGALSDVKNIVIHGDFDKYTLENDIAVMQLSRPIRNAKINYPKLTSSTLIPSYGTIAGWGAVDSDFHDPSFYLQAVEVGTIDSHLCQLFLPGIKITDKLICAGIHSGGRDFCELDQGTGMVYKNILIGVASKSFCGEPHLPGLYVSIASYSDWLTEVIEKELK